MFSLLFSLVAHDLIVSGKDKEMTLFNPMERLTTSPEASLQLWALLEAEVTGHLLLEL